MTEEQCDAAAKELARKLNAVLVEMEVGCHVRVKALTRLLCLNLAAARNSEVCTMEMFVGGFVGFFEGELIKAVRDFDAGGPAQ